MIARVLPALLLASLLGACNGSLGTRTEPRPVAGRWSMELDLNGRSMPFHVELIGVDSAGLQLQVINGDEVILVDDLERRGDSLFVRMPLFDSEFKGIIRTDSLVEGHWYNYLKGPDYRIPFVAHAGNRPPTKAATSTLGGQWEVHFNPSSPDGYNAIGIFEQEPDGRATGTFVTETGEVSFHGFLGVPIIQHRHVLGVLVVRQRVHRRGRSLLVGTPNLCGHFVAVHGDTAGCLDTEPHLVATNLDDGDDDVRADDDRLVRFAAQHQHQLAPNGWRVE